LKKEQARGGKSGEPKKDNTLVTADAAWLCAGSGACGGT